MRYCSGMAWGGARIGAGGKKGGSKRASPLRHALRAVSTDEARARDLIVAEFAGSERDPLRIVLEMAADETKPDQVRIYAAKVALPFVHSSQPTTLASVHVHARLQADADVAKQALHQILNARRSALIEAKPEPTGQDESGP
jgi:hypothetical protein